MLKSTSTFAAALTLVGLTATAPAAIAQGAVAALPQPFDAISAALAPEYHFDFARNYFPTEASYQAAVKQLYTLADKIQAYKGKTLASPQNLYDVLSLSDRFNTLFLKCYFYDELKYSVDTKDTADRSRQLKLDSDLSPKLSFITTEVQNITPAQEARFMAAVPRLKVYSYEIEQAVRDRPHTLTAREEELLSAVQPMMTSWEADEYDLFMDRAPWGKVTDPDSGKLLDVRQDDGRIFNSPVRQVRAEGAKKQTAAYQQQRDLFAFDVIHVAQAENKLAQLRRYKNGQDAAFFNLFLTYPQIESAYDTVISHGALNKQFQNLRRDRIARYTGYDKVHYYDQSVVPPGVVKPRFTISQATDTIKASTAYLGPEWNNELSLLLDPANGRLDIVPGANRVPNAFSVPTPGTKSVFYDYGYQGYLQDVVTLAHESGHVVHSALQDDNHVPVAYADGPRFFTESYAILDEYVLIDHLYQQEKDPALKVYYLEQLMQEMMGFYGTTRIAAIEKAIYEGVDKGTISNADDLDKLTYGIASKVSIWNDIDPEVNNLWQEIPHYYSSPTYYVNYVFASLLAQTYFAQYKQDPIGFGKRFTALERNGFNDTPDHLLKRFLNIDMQDPKTYAAVFAQQQKYLTDLQALYNQNPVAPASHAAGVH